MDIYDMGRYSTLERKKEYSTLNVKSEIFK